MSYLLLNKELHEAAGLEGKYSGQVIITGSAECLWEDYLKAIELTENEDLICVNLSAICFYHRHINHLVSLHHKKVKNFYQAAMIQRTEREEYPARYKSRPHQLKFKKIITHSTHANSSIDLVWDIPNPGGTSGLFATHIAIKLGYDKIILCGIPVNNSRRFYDSPNKSFKYESISVQEPWRVACRSTNNFDGKVKSMSGKTKELLGEPTKEWLKS